MKQLSITLILMLTLMVGCGKKEEPQASLPEEAATPVPSQQEQLGKAATAAVKSIDWASLSWNNLSSVPYENKEQLLEWAAPQINGLKEKLTKAALEKGKLSLSSLGDSGWQGAIKKTVEALESVRNSSPETWEMARNSLMSAWEALQHEAEKYISQG